MNVFTPRVATQALLGAAMGIQPGCSAILAQSADSYIRGDANDCTDDYVWVGVDIGLGTAWTVAATGFAIAGFEGNGDLSGLLLIPAGLFLVPALAHFVSSGTNTIEDCKRAKHFEHSERWQGTQR